MTFSPSSNATLSGVIGATLTTATGYAGIATVAGGGVTKAGPNSLTLTAGELYTGATAVQAGTLALGPGGGLAATAVTVSPAATLSVLPASNGSTIGIGASLSLNSTSNFNMADGTANTASVTGAGTLSGANFTFDLGDGGSGVAADKLAIGGAATLAAGNLITINGFGTTAPSGTYTVISAASGLNVPADFALASPRVVINGISYSLTLGNSATAETITIGTASTLAAYFNGAAGNTTLNATSGSTTNWSSTPDGLSNLTSQPTGTTDVYFTGTNLTTTQTIGGLGVASNWNSLNFLAGALQVTIGNTGGFILTLQGGGITDASSNSATFNSPITMAAPQSFSNTGSATLTVGGAIVNSGFALTTAGTGNISLAAMSGTGAFNQNSTGVVTLTGAETATGTVSANAGTLVIPTGGSIATSGLIAVGTLNGSNTVMKITGTGSVATSSASTSAINIGGQANNTAVSVQVAGTFTATNAAAQIVIGNDTGGAGPSGVLSNTYAALSISGGTVTSGSYLVVGGGNTRAVYNQTGGTVTVSNNFMTIADNSVGTGSGVANFSGGTFTANATGGGIYVGEAGVGTLNVFPGATVNAGNATGAKDLMLGVTSFGTGTVNLLGGTLSTFKVSKGTGTGNLNFNGGTLSFNGAGTFTGLTNTYINAAGGTININANAVTIAQSLLAPTLNGIGTAGAAVPGLSVSGGGYIDTPLVLVTGGNGSGATANATIDASGNLTNIVVTNPGTGYTAAPNFTLVGGGLSNNGAITGTATLAANSSGALIINGANAGVLSLSGNNTYSGGTQITGTTTTPNVTVLSATALGTGTVTLKNAGASFTTLNLGATVNVANPLSIDLSLKRNGIQATAGSPTLSGPVSMVDGSATVIFASNTAATTFTVSGGITASAAMTSDISFRGNSGALGLVSTNPILAPNATLDINGAAKLDLQCDRQQLGEYDLIQLRKLHPRRQRRYALDCTDRGQQ